MFLGLRTLGLYAGTRNYVVYTTVPDGSFDSIITGSGAEFGDYMGVDKTVTPTGDTLTVDVDGVPTIIAGGDGSRVTFNADLYSVREQRWTGSVVENINNTAPILIGGGSDIVMFLALNQAVTPTDMGLLASDVEGDPITVIGTPPTGLSMVGNVLTGTPTVQAITAVTYNWQDSLGATTPANVIFVVGKVPVPDVTGLNMDSVDDLMAPVYLNPVITFEFSDDIPEDFVVSQIPGHGAFADPNSNVNVVVSKGPDGDVVIIETGTMKFDPVEKHTKSLGAIGAASSVHKQRPIGSTGMPYNTPRKTPTLATPATIGSSVNTKKGKQ